VISFKTLKSEVFQIFIPLCGNGCGLKVVAASKPTNFQPTTNLVGRIRFPKPKTSHPFNLLLPAGHSFSLIDTAFLAL
jgi:hypothetical protein